MTFAVLIVRIEQSEEFQESRVHCTLAGIKSVLKIGEWVPWHKRGGGGVPEPSPGYAPDIMCEYQCDKAVTKNDTREVI